MSPPRDGIPARVAVSWKVKRLAERTVSRRRSQHPKYKETKIGAHRLRPESQMMSYGYDPMLSEGAIKCPIFQTSTFVFESAEAGKAFFELAYGLREKAPREEAGLIYIRLHNT